MIFYEMDNKGHKTVDIAEATDWESVICPKHKGHQRPGKRITDLHVDVVSRRVVDFSWTMICDIVVTDRVIRLLREAELTGFQVKPVVIDSLPRGVELEELPTFWEFCVTGQAGHAHPDSGIRLKYECKACGLKEYSAHEHGIIVDENQWDGTDFCYVVEYPKHILVAEAAKKIIEGKRLTNVTFTPSEELEWPWFLPKP